MIRVVQHIPGYVYGVTLHDDTVADVAAVLALPWVARWASEPGFYRWSLGPALELMAEMDGGDQWWLVAHVSGDPAVELPPWTPTAAGLARVDQWNLGETALED